MATWTLRETVAGLTVERSVTADGEGSFDGSLTANQTDVEVDCDFVYTRIKGFIVECAAAIVIETNANDASGGQTINVPAGGWSWLSGGVTANPFSASVTRLFLTNTTATPVKIKWLYDRTP
jgi:hypothetical protein